MQLLIAIVHGVMFSQNCITLCVIHYSNAECP